MAKEKIIDKVKLERIIDDYLTNDIPISLLTEKYALTYQQIQLLLNRIRGFSRQSRKIKDILGEYSTDELSDNYLIIPHDIEEKYPLKPEEQMALFKRLEELKELMADIPDKEKLEESFIKLKDKISKYDQSLITKIEKFIQELDNLNNNSSDNIVFIMRKYGFSPSNINDLSKFYNQYLKDLEELSELERELKNADDNELRKSYEQEYLSIREELVLRNIKLVNWCIRSFFNNIALPKDETQMYGIEGLIKGMNGFNCNLEYRFSTYAVPNIVHNIERHFKELYGMDWADFIAKESIKYYRRLMREEDPTRTTDATPSELADTGLINLSARKIAGYDEMIDSILSNSDVYSPMEVDIKPTRKNEMPITFEDYESIDDYENKTLISDEHDMFEDIFINPALRKSLFKALSTLTEREQKVLTLRFGLETGTGKSLEEVGLVLKVTKERVRQIEAKALRKLRHPTRAQHLRVFLEDSYQYHNYIQSISNISEYERIISKLLNLLFKNISYDGLLIFMNMENLNWSNQDLNKKIIEIRDILTTANELELDPSELKDHLYSRRFIRISNEFAKKICANYVEISEHINRCIERYIPEEEQKTLKKG